MKLAITLTAGLLLAASLLSNIIQSENPLAHIPIDALIIAISASILANGVLAVLKIIDWIESRKAKQDIGNG